MPAAVTRHRTTLSPLAAATLAARPQAAAGVEPCCQAPAAATAARSAVVAARCRAVVTVARARSSALVALSASTRTSTQIVPEPSSDGRPRTGRADETRENLMVATQLVRPRRPLTR